MRALVLALTLLLTGLGPAGAGIDRVFESGTDTQTTRDRLARTLGQPWLSTSRSYALVIGISDYAGGYKDLPTANDALRMKDFLIDEAEFHHVHVLTEERATKARIEQLMEETFPDLLDTNDRFLFYWSGHGDQRRLPNGTSRGYLPLATTEPTRWSRMVGMRDLRHWDDLLAARQALYLLDACFSGLAGTVSKTSPRDLTIEQLARPSRHLLTAGTGEEEAIAGAAWGGSLFTEAVLDGLRGAADATTTYEADNVVSLNELVAYIKIRVAAEKQRAGWSAAITPQLRDLSTNEGEFFFAWPPTGEPTPEPAPSPALEVEPKGHNEREVREIQTMLAAMGFAPGPIDGIFGLRTRGALLRFQQEQDLNATAELDAATRRALLMAWAERAGPKPTPLPEPDKVDTGRHADLAVFTDTLADGSPCGFCPEMVVVPSGSFMMGSPEDEEGRYDDEGPRHRVTISEPFAMGRNEVTFAQWDACVEAGGCEGYRPDHRGWGRGDRPVIDVSWNDAQLYVEWLSDQTGKSYRLPSEAEWEHACRAGTTTPFSIGRTISTSQANYNGNGTYGSGKKGEYRGETLPVGSFDPNPWGLFDMHGNVWEWVEDCWHDNYQGAPSDGRAWLAEDGGDCSRRVVRGGSWYDNPVTLRSALRYRDERDDRYGLLGFRVSRTLTP